MEYICSHCRNHGSDWIKSGDSVVCPKCYGFTLLGDAVVRRAEPVKTKGYDMPPGFEELFRGLHKD
jgi:hypothetical protein